MQTDTAFLIMDMQNGLLKEAYQPYITLDRTGMLLARARETATPVVYIQHCGQPGEPLQPDTPGWQIHPSLTPIRGDPVVSKRGSDGFYGTALQRELESRHIRHLVIAGMLSEFCIDTTCRQAISLGYAVTLAADAHTTVHNGLLLAPQIIAHHNSVLARLAHPDGHITVRPADTIAF